MLNQMRILTTGQSPVEEFPLLFFPCFAGTYQLWPALTRCPAGGGVRNRNSERPVEEFYSIVSSCFDQKWSAMTGTEAGRTGWWWCEECTNNERSMAAKCLQTSANVCKYTCTECVNVYKCVQICSNVCKWVQNRSKCVQNGARNVRTMGGSWPQNVG